MAGRSPPFSSRRRVGLSAHREVDGPHRASVLSVNAIVAQPAGALGAITLAALADGTSISTATVVGGIICALAAPLRIPAWRAERVRKAPHNQPLDVATEL